MGSTFRGALLAGAAVDRNIADDALRAILSLPDTLQNQLRAHATWAASNGARGRRLDLEGADLSGIELPGAYLSGARLVGCTFAGANLRGAKL